MPQKNTPAVLEELWTRMLDYDMRQDEWSDAKAFLESQLDQNPKRDNLAYQLAYLLLYCAGDEVPRHQYNDGVALLERAVDWNPANLRARYHLACESYTSRNDTRVLEVLGGVEELIDPSDEIDQYIFFQCIELRFCAYMRLDRKEESAATASKLLVMMDTHPPEDVELIRTLRLIDLLCDDPAIHKLTPLSQVVRWLSQIEARA